MLPAGLRALDAETKIRLTAIVRDATPKYLQVGTIVTVAGKQVQGGGGAGQGEGGAGQGGRLTAIVSAEFFLKAYKSRGTRRVLRR